MSENGKVQNILVTGAAGMIGSAVSDGLLSAGYRVIGVDIRDNGKTSLDYLHCTVDLSDTDSVRRIIKENNVDRVVHLAALAHSTNGKKYTWDDYKHLNVDCSVSLFEAADEVPVLFISTVDVYGFARGTVNTDTEPKPVSHYALSKTMAETECKKLPSYTIFRLSPVYTDTVKRDIQKRYYLKFPNIAYRIGKGTEYEILNINGAVSAIVDWCGTAVKNDIHIIKDPVRMYTPDYINAERAKGRAKTVLCIPAWMVKAGYSVLKAFTGENKYTYLLHKAVCPLRSE